MSEQLENPEGVGRPPVAFVTVEDDCGVVGDSKLLHEALELLLAHVVAHDRIVQVVLPVDFLCAGDVARVVEKNVFVRFEQADAAVVQVSGDPLGAY